MNTNVLSKHYIASTRVQRLCQQIKETHLSPISVNGLLGSSLSFVMAEIFKKTSLPLLLIFDDKEEAAYYLNDMELLLHKEEVLFYPSSYRRPYQIEQTDNANILLRAEVLSKINAKKKPTLIVTYTDAIFEKVITQKTLEKNTLKIEITENLSIEFLNETLFEYQFKRVDFVGEPGEFSVRGGIVDVFSFSNIEPYRIEFFGDMVESIRTFDVETQLSEKAVKNIYIIPNITQKENVEASISFLDYIPKESIIFVKNIDVCTDRLNKLFENAEKEFASLSEGIKLSTPDHLFCKEEEIKNKLSAFKFISGTAINTPLKYSFNIAPQPSFNKQIPLLAEELKRKEQLGYLNYICCATEEQTERFRDIFEEIGERVRYETLVLPLSQGFVDKDLQIACFTDHQIFERYHKFRLKNSYAKKQTITLKQLNQLKIGDYVTHIDHGIGKYGGLQKIDVNGQKQEAIKLLYGDRDILYVSIHALHKISKFKSKDGKSPKVHKLGSNAWKNLKQKTKKRVKEIAFSLINLYAKRKLKKGFPYGSDSILQNQLEASFIYEDTPDQHQATIDVKKDMEREYPMDRLVCGDVGFGKTEVAIRAAFKAVDNGKQVAVLVPTTILAFQHLKTFRNRLKNFPIVVDYINRFRTTKDKKEIYEQLKSGTIDIIIGTHQLTNKTIIFKDLGLLVVDEEQKFGVAVKEKLKTIKENVDVLTLTATPIPRTLQFSLMAARDLSIIHTPPPNRYPIESQVIRLDEGLIRDAVVYEMQRGGQVFFVHNRIENIKEVAGMLQRLIPDAKIAIGHGQMEGKKLEELIFSFMNGVFDVLVSTTIIESGLDVSNANTIFINNAHHFGLSDLHQMRGRVGRSNKKAFCYFITPPYSSMTADARKRIGALEQFTDLGSGFNIAMKDLEIRGAGDILGGEQSGFINSMGFDTYQKILSEAMEELKEKEFASLYAKNSEKSDFYIKEVQIDTDFELLFPDAYINNVSERFNLYKELSLIKEENSLQIFEKKLIDRFGPLPKTSKDLLNSLKIKWIASRLGLEKIILKQQKLIGFFIGNPENKFYQTDLFGKLLQHIGSKDNPWTIYEKQTKNGLRLCISLPEMNSISKIVDTLENFLNYCK